MHSEMLPVGVHRWWGSKQTRCTLPEHKCIQCNYSLYDRNATRILNSPCCTALNFLQDSYNTNRKMKSEQQAAFNQSDKPMKARNLSIVCMCFWEAVCTSKCWLPNNSITCKCTYKVKLESRLPYIFSHFLYHCIALGVQWDAGASLSHLWTRWGLNSVKQDHIYS